MKNSKINIYFVFILVAATLWGTAGIFVRTAEGYSLSGMQLVLGRASVTSVLVAGLMLFKDKTAFKVKLKDLWLFILAGLFSIVLFNYSYYTTMSLASLSVAAVLLYTAPFFVVIISRFVFSSKFTLNKITALFIAFIGCCFVSGLFDSSQRISSKALFFGLLTGFGYALYTIFGELLLKRGYSTLTITFYVFLSAFICSLPLTDWKSVVNAVAQKPISLVVIFLMALLNTVIPYILYTNGLKGVDPSVAPIIATLEPVVATVIGAVIFKEKITFFGALGIILVLVSVVILNMKRINVTANAKINLILSITGKREDGYHFIDTVMQSVSLSDRVSVKPSKAIKVNCNIKELSGEENIAFKAAELFFSETGLNSGALISIKKKIPAAAGLGGGSADAATVLVALNKLYGTNLEDSKLEEMALTLGADVPFFIKGGTVRAEGIGEKLTSLKNFEEVYIILAKADKKPSTGEMYKRLDSENPPKPRVDEFINALNNNDKSKMYSFIDNSFRAVWQNNNTEKKLSEFSPLAVCLSGSGPTCFAIFNKKSEAKKALKTLKREKIESYLVKPVNKALIID